MKRRTFLKLAGIGSLSLATGCDSRPANTLYSLVKAPDDMVTGEPSWYATTCRECPAGCGVVAKVREGRVVKLEGNPLHPINKGKLCMRGQAALQGIYNPDRLTTPLLKTARGSEPVSHAKAAEMLKARTAAAAAKGENRVHLLTETVGEVLADLFTESLARWGSGPPLVFEPFAYESTKTAHKMVFGIDGLPSYRMERADVVVSLGADFLETWLSPVEYARKFKAMHAYGKGGKGLFFHISPCQSLTAANADLWLPPVPGGEGAVGCALLRMVLAEGRGDHLPADFREALIQTVAPFTPEKTARTAGVPPETLGKIGKAVLAASAPLVLGGSAAGGGDAVLQADLAAALLNCVLDPNRSLIDFDARHRVETAARRADILRFFADLKEGPAGVLLLNSVNPVYAMPGAGDVRDALAREDLFVVAFSNFMDETTQLADLVVPVQPPLESWDEYGGKTGLLSTLQPAMGAMVPAPHVGDLLLGTAFGAENRPAPDYASCLAKRLMADHPMATDRDRLETFRAGGRLEDRPEEKTGKTAEPPADLTPEPYLLNILAKASEAPEEAITFTALPSIRFFDGRGANRPWLCEVPDPLTKIAWQTPILLHPETMKKAGLRQEDVITATTRWGTLEAPVYESDGIRPGTAAMAIGQGHAGFGRYADGMGLNPFHLLSPLADTVAGGPNHGGEPVEIRKTGRGLPLAHTDGSRIQHGRTIALSISLTDLVHGEHPEKHGLAMHEFPLVLPLPEGYSPHRDIYPPHEHAGYRWAMTVDLDRCIGCGACAAACYAENNIGVVGPERILEGREMSWLMIQRYLDPDRPEKVAFLPMLCQHCDNAPCESVCPVYAPHHSKEGLNNQIYNRCIGTRFCSQNCPYKVRRFNWFDWEWPAPMNLQLNPEVTVRSKGVMEKCSFCVQRIKDAHGQAKNEGRAIRDGEVVPACVQTCPTGAFVFGNLMDPQSRVRRMVEDVRAYQILGYINTKPAVIYLKKVVQEI